MSKANPIIRNYMKLKGVMGVEIADELGKTPPAFSLELRYPMSVQRTLELIDIINQIAEQKERA